MMDTMMSTQSNLPDLPTALAVSDSPKIFKELPLHIRGSHLSLGKPVPRGFLQVVQASLKKEAPAFKPDQSGRSNSPAGWPAPASAHLPRHGEPHLDLALQSRHRVVRR